MKKLLFAGSLLLAGSICLQDISSGHGGTYRGPGDTVPPGGGAGGGGAGPAGPQGPGGPSGPGAGNPGGAGPVTGGPGTGGPAGNGSGTGPVTGGAIALGPELTLWSFWWEFNKDEYLSLRKAIHTGAIVTGTDNFFLGQGEQEKAKDSLRPSEEQIRNIIVPALIKTLDKETNNDIVTGAMIALAKIGDVKDESGVSEFEQIIASFLDDGNQEIAETAAIALGILANDHSVQILSDLLTDSPAGRKATGKSGQVQFRTRAFAAYGLALIGNRTASEDVRRQIVATLAEVIAADDSASRDIGVACMVGLGLVPLATMEHVANEDGSPVAPETSRRAQIAFIQRFFEETDHDFMARAHAPAAMARLLRDSGYDDLIQVVAEDLVERLDDRSKKKEKRREVEMSCVLALGMLGDCDEKGIDKDIREALDEALDAADGQVQIFSRIAMGQVGARNGSGDPTKGREMASKSLLKSLTNGKSAETRWAGLGIGVMGRALSEQNLLPSPELSVRLREQLKRAKSPLDVGAFCIATGILRDQESTGIVLEKLDRISDEEARGYAAVALGLMNAREAIDPISEIVKESKYRPELLKQAAIALGLLGDKDTVDDLKDMLADAKGLATQASLSTALGFIGDKRSVDPLIEMMENTQRTETARGFAAVALGIVADKEDFPWNAKIARDINYRASTETLNSANAGTGVLNIL